jgi:hypothetical protein
MLKCEICGNEATGVFSSCMGPISHAYCVECGKAGREVWTTLVGGLFGVTKETVAEWTQPVIDATCEFYGKTEDQLWEEVKKLEESYEEYMRNQCP